MKRNRRVAIFLLAAVVMALILAVAVLSSQNQPAGENQADNLSSQKVKLGLSGFFPANFPNHSNADLTQFWQDINQYTDTYGVHVNWSDTRLLDITKDNYNGEIVLVLGFQDPEEWKSQEQIAAFIAKVKKLAEDYPDLKYIGLGNEINSLADKYPGQFDDFVAAYKDVYTQLKQEYPDRLFFPTWQYEDLLGFGYLISGRNFGPDAWGIVDELDGFYDLFAITTYPYFDNTDPTELNPDYYFDEIFAHTAKPIAITETGWMTREKYGGALKLLSDEGYTGSEEEQDQYLERLLRLVKSRPDIFEFVNWIGLNDFSDWVDGDSPDTLVVFDSIGLRYNDASEKLVWRRWMAEFEE